MSKALSHNSSTVAFRGSMTQEAPLIIAVFPPSPPGLLLLPIKATPTNSPIKNIVRAAEVKVPPPTSNASFTKAANRRQPSRYAHQKSARRSERPSQSCTRWTLHLRITLLGRVVPHAASLVA